MKKIRLLTIITAITFSVTVAAFPPAFAGPEQGDVLIKVSGR